MKKWCMKTWGEANEPDAEKGPQEVKRKFKRILPDDQRQQLQATIRCDERGDEPVRTLEVKQGRAI